MTKTANRSNQSAQPGPVWPRIVYGEPQRHPARSRKAYIPRGQLRPGSVTLWGIQDQSFQRRERPANSPPKRPPTTQAQRKWLTLSGLTVAAIGAFVVAVPVANTVMPPRPPTQVVVNTPTLLPNPPQVSVVAPQLTAAPVIVAPPVPSVANDPRPIATPAPQMPNATDVTDAFVCGDCTSTEPRLAGLTITLRGRQADQDRIADQIGSMGAAEVTTMPEGIAVASHQVRYFRTQDQAAAQALAERYDAVLVDVTWLANDAPAKIDLLLAATQDVN